MVNTVFIVVTMAETARKTVTHEMSAWQRFGIVYCMTLAVLMTSLLIPFFLLHMSFMTKSQTTIEFCEKRTKSSGATYDLGLWKNITNTLGSNPLLWLLPLAPPEGDGLHFESTSASNQVPLIEDSKQPSEKADNAAVPTNNPEVTSAE